MNSRHKAALAILALPGVLCAQSLTAPLALSLPGGTRVLGLGNTGVASRDDEVIFYNPAQLVSATGFSVSGQYLSSTAGTGAMSAVTRFNNGGIGIGVRFANYETQNTFLPAGRDRMLDAGPQPATSLELTAGIAQTIKKFRVGVAGKYAAETYGSVRLTRPLADVGIARDFFRTTFGLAVQNIGDDNMAITAGAGKVPAITAHLPVRTTLGAQRNESFGPFDFVGTAAVSLFRDERVLPSGGIEANYSWLNGYNIALRAGGRRTMPGEEWFTGGAGFTADRVTFDYALETLSNQRVGHRFGIRVR